VRPSPDSRVVTHWCRHTMISNRPRDGSPPKPACRQPPGALCCFNRHHRLKACCMLGSGGWSYTQCWSRANLRLLRHGCMSHPTSQISIWGRAYSENKHACARPASFQSLTGPLSKDYPGPQHGAGKRPGNTTGCYTSVSFSRYLLRWHLRRSMSEPLVKLRRRGEGW
jgi:hypothetical protein